MDSLFQSYDANGSFDEMMSPERTIRPAYHHLVENLNSLGTSEILTRQYAAEQALLSMGITFNVYGSGQGLEKIFPFDLIPRIIAQSEWKCVEHGIKQRVHALNLFLQDIYSEQKIIHDGIIPREIVETSSGYLKEVQGLQPPGGIWIHVSGIDLIRHNDGHYYVLEDNVRVPSGVSYVLGNREIMKRSLPDSFRRSSVSPVYDYPLHLRDTLQSLSEKPEPVMGVLTPGVYNSAYFEHSFLAQQMGVPLVEGRDLVVENDRVLMRTTYGLQPIDVIYRRVDDTFLDPLVFRSDSLLGVPGIMNAFRKGNVALANAPGTGVADDKVVYAYVPEIIQYYTGEDPVLKTVPTYLCWRDSDRNHVLQNLEQLVVKEADGSGGYGMLMGPSSSEKERTEFAEKIKTYPRKFIAQPVMNLSTVPTLVDQSIEARHVDLRPYVLYSNEGIQVTPGGLTRVALRKGSLIVNSSQGGGSKDTWIVNDSETTDPSIGRFGEQNNERGGFPC